MPTLLLDTAVFVDLLRGYTPARNWLDSLAVGDAVISVITVAELLAGCRNQHEQQVVEREVSSYTIVWLSEPVSQTAITWYRQFHLSHGVGFLDCLIGAIAHSYNLTLATTNDRHFRPFRNVAVSRPY